MKKQKMQGSVKILLVGIAMLCLVLGYYYYLSNKNSAVKEEEAVTLTEVQEVLIRNLDNNYPPSPREVLKYYCELAQCIHNETYSDEEFLQLAAQAQKLYDDELIANKTQEQYIEDLKWDTNNLKEKEVVISSYSVVSSTDVEYFDQDGYEWARASCTFTLRQGTGLTYSEEIFLLRKDANGHWKIYGWKLAEGEASNGDLYDGE